MLPKTLTSIMILTILEKYGFMGVYQIIFIHRSFLFHGSDLR